MTITELLDLFTGKEIPNCPHFANPDLQGKMVYATDTYIILGVPKDLTAVCDSHDLFPDIQEWIALCSEDMKYFGKKIDLVKTPKFDDGVTIKFPVDQYEYIYPSISIEYWRKVLKVAHFFNESILLESFAVGKFLFFRIGKAMVVVANKYSNLGDNDNLRVVFE